MSGQCTVHSSVWGGGQGSPSDRRQAAATTGVLRQVQALDRLVDTGRSQPLHRQSGRSSTPLDARRRPSETTRVWACCRHSSQGQQRHQTRHPVLVADVLLALSVGIARGKWFVGRGGHALLHSTWKLSQEMDPGRGCPTGAGDGGEARLSTRRSTTRHGPLSGATLSLAVQNLPVHRRRGQTTHHPRAGPTEPGAAQASWRTSRHARTASRTLPGFFELKGTSQTCDTHPTPALLH